MTLFVRPSFCEPYLLKEGPFNSLQNYAQGFFSTRKAIPIYTLQAGKQLIDSKSVHQVPSWAERVALFFITAGVAIIVLLAIRIHTYCTHKYVKLIKAESTLIIEIQEPEQKLEKSLPPLPKLPDATTIKSSQIHWEAISKESHNLMIPEIPEEYSHVKATDIISFFKAARQERHQVFIDFEKETGFCCWKKMVKKQVAVYRSTLDDVLVDDGIKYTTDGEIKHLEDRLNDVSRLDDKEAELMLRHIVIFISKKREEDHSFVELIPVFTSILLSFRNCSGNYRTILSTLFFALGSDPKINRYLNTTLGKIHYALLTHRREVFSSLANQFFPAKEYLHQANVIDIAEREASVRFCLGRSQVKGRYDESATSELKQKGAMDELENIQKALAVTCNPLSTINWLAQHIKSKAPKIRTIDIDAWFRSQYQFKDDELYENAQLKEGALFFFLRAHGIV